MRTHALLMIVVVAGSALEGGAQSTQSIEDARLVEVRVEPEAPHLGQAFDLNVTLRLRPGVMAIFPDTLPPNDGVYSVGPGSWREAPAPGDSVEIRASYPVISFQEGLIELPRIELWIRASTDDLGTVRSALSAGDPEGASVSEIERRVIRPGSLEVGPYPPMLAEDVVLEPRGAADVLGGEWSLWRLLAVVVGVLGVGTAGVVLIPQWWSSSGAARLARLRGRSPRQVALRELEQVRTSGWHKDGRIDDFYAASTDTLRRFLERIEPDWNVALTSNEVIAKLEERWGAIRSEQLSSTVEVAERVKFAAHQPGDEAAERDWKTIRDWVRGAPES